MVWRQRTRVRVCCMRAATATGLAIETALVHAVRNHPAITVLEHTFARDLVVEDDRVVGLDILTESGEARRLRADSIVLASGGAGQLYPHTTNPSVTTGDGVAMALRAGCAACGRRVLPVPPDRDGAVRQLSHLRGRPWRWSSPPRTATASASCWDIHPLGELAPRDVVARGIAGRLKMQDGEPVLLDATALGAEFLAQRFPTIDAACRLAGLDWAHKPIPITPAAHYWMGGVRTDIWAGRLCRVCSRLERSPAPASMARTGWPRTLCSKASSSHGAARSCSATTTPAHYGAWPQATRSGHDLLDG